METVPKDLEITISEVVIRRVRVKEGVRRKRWREDSNFWRTTEWGPGKMYTCGGVCHYEWSNFDYFMEHLVSANIHEATTDRESNEITHTFFTVTRGYPPSSGYIN